MLDLGIVALADLEDILLIDELWLDGEYALATKRKLDQTTVARDHVDLLHAALAVVEGDQVGVAEAAAWF